MTCQKISGGEQKKIMKVHEDPIPFVSGAESVTSAAINKIF